MLQICEPNNTLDMSESEVILGPLIQRKSLLRDHVHLLGNEVMKPETKEGVVFKDFFIVGSSFLVQDITEEILDAFNIKMHHLTPNGISKDNTFYLGY
jgi:hypothetical protein